MKYPFRSHILPYFPIGAGLLGLALRIWLFSEKEESGLLPAKHFADYALFILTALVLLILFLSSRKLTPRQTDRTILRYMNVGSCILGGLGLILSATFHLAGSTARLARLATALSLAGGLVMLVMAFQYLRRRRIHYGMPAFVTVVLMLDTVTQCQVWGSIPQLQLYFFPLLASVFLILTAYYKTTFTARRPKLRQLAFCSQCALYFCFLSLNSSQWLLYLGMLFWAGVQIYPCTMIKKKV